MSLGRITILKSISVCPGPIGRLGRPKDHSPLYALILHKNPSYISGFVLTLQSVPETWLEDRKYKEFYIKMILTYRLLICFVLIKVTQAKSFKMHSIQVKIFHFINEKPYDQFHYFIAKYIPLLLF